MKSFVRFHAVVFLRGLLFLGVIATITANTARGGLTVDMHFYHDNFGYYFYPFLSANTNMPGFPDGVYQIASPQIPANGSRLVYYATNGTINGCYNGDCGGGSYYSTFDSMIYGVTNGLWSIAVTNNASTNTYHFSVTVNGLTSNTFGALPEAVYPTNGQVNIPNQPEMQWTGPANWAGTLYVSDNFVDTNGNNNFEAGGNLAPNATSWTPGVVLPNGTNQFSVTYQSNVTAIVTCSQPTNNLAQPISAWVSTSTIEEHFIYAYQYDVTFIVGATLSDFDFYLVARYNFEGTNNPYMDSSGNGNDPDNIISNGPSADTFSTNATIGQYARLFFGDTGFAFTQANPAYQNLSNALSGNFSVTAWVKTTNTVGSDSANAYYGAPIFFSGSDYNDDCTIPLTITGSKAAFTIVASEGPGVVTLHSTTSVNDGNYHFLAVTRLQSSGLMSLYVDGNLQATGTGITTPVITQGYIKLAGGGGNDGVNFYNGLMDDVRVYSTNLSAADVSYLAGGGDPNGSNTTTITLASAIGATNLTVTTSGDANWFVETTNTFNGAPAADQSGALNSGQSSVLQATVMGPGTITFAWSTLTPPDDFDFDLEFDVDGSYEDNINNVFPWYTDGPFSIGPGEHTLTWTAYGGDYTSDAGFLDDVVFTPTDTSPVSANVTLNVYREQDPTFGDIFLAFPGFNSVTPAGSGSTTNRIQSPNGYFSGDAEQGTTSSSSAILNSLSSLLNECTNGLWSLYINYGLPNQRQFQFSLSINGLTTNLLQAVNIITPTNGAAGVPLNTAFQWLGPSDYSSLYVSKQYVDGSGNVNTNLPVTDTNWPSPPMLIAGTNQFYVSYVSNNFPSVSFSVPIDTTDSQTVSVWSANVDLNTTATANFVATVVPSKVTLTNPRTTGGNFQFSFLSQSGLTNTVYYRTNLSLGVWQTYTNILGDGTVKTIVVPLSAFSPSKSGFIRVGTQ